jgi:hypothetical protein
MTSRRRPHRQRINAREDRDASLGEYRKQPFNRFVRGESALHRYDTVVGHLNDPTFAQTLIWFFSGYFSREEVFARRCEVFTQIDRRNTRYLSGRPARAYVMSSPEDFIILGLTVENWLLLAGLTSIVAIAVLASKL